MHNLVVLPVYWKEHLLLYRDTHLMFQLTINQVCLFLLDRL